MKLLDEITYNAFRLHRDRGTSYSRKLLRTLAERVNGFRRGGQKTVYIPLAYPLDGLEHLLAPFIVLEPDDVYKELVDLLEFLSRQRSLFYDHVQRARVECVSMAGRYDDAYGFADQLLAIHRITLMNLAMVLQELPSIDVLSAMVMLASGSHTYTNILKTCWKLKSFRNTLYKISRVYETLLVALGVTYHYDPSRKVWLAIDGRHRPRTLHATPFAQAYIYMTLGNFSPNEYVEAYRTFEECTVRMYGEPLNYTVKICSEELEKWRKIGVNPEQHVREVVYTTHSLIKEALQMA